MVRARCATATQTQLAGLQQLHPLVRPALLTVLEFVQLVYSFGYFDASVMLAFIGELPGYYDIVDTSVFYAHSLIGNAFAPLMAACLLYHIKERVLEKRPSAL